MENSGFIQLDALANFRKTLATCEYRHIDGMEKIKDHIVAMTRVYGGTHSPERVEIVLTAYIEMHIVHLSLASNVKGEHNTNDSQSS